MVHQHSNNAVKKLDLKCFTNFTTTSSPLILNTYHSQQKPDQEEHTQLQYPLLQDTVQTDVILPPDHPRMEQPAPGNSGSQVPGLFQVQACCPPVTRQTTPPLPPPLLFLMSTTPHLLCPTPFHYISEVSTATSTNQHNHQNIDVG